MFDESMFESVGERFKALGEPARLRILDALRRGELTVGELVDSTGLSQANASKHLQLLNRLGFIERRKHGLFVHYRLADEDVFALCDVMCGRIVRGRGDSARGGTAHTRRKTARRGHPAEHGRT